MNAAATWQARLVVPVAVWPAFEEALSDGAAALTAFETGDGTRWRIDAHFTDEPDRERLQARIAETARALGIPLPALTWHTMRQRDWLAENRKDFPPVRVGRVFLHGRHDRGRAPPGHIALEIEAGLAFGTGRHETTRGCVMLLQRLRRHVRVRRPLDLGCGTAVLAMVMARLWHVTVMAADIDPVAVRTAAGNLHRNRLAQRVRLRRARGVDHAALRSGPAFDLVCANILYAPLRQLAPDLARRVSAGGYVVLSGVLRHQAAALSGFYREHGFATVDRLHVGNWSSLLVRRSRVRPPSAGP